MKKLLLIAGTLVVACSAQAQKIKFNPKVIKAAESGVKAATFSDADAAKLAKEAVDWMDANNKVAGDKDPYSIRLKKLVAKHLNEDGLKLNFKVYKVTDINAFACADGSVRVFSSLMDIMTDEELLAIIGHEIGHVKNHDTRDAIRDAYKRAALTEAANSQSGVATALTQSQLGDLASAMMSSKYSRKQESQADNYGYEFMKKHNYKVMAMASAFKKLEDLSSGNAQKQSSMEKMLSSHPDSGNRAKAVADKAKKDGLDK